MGPKTTGSTLPRNCTAHLKGRKDKERHLGRLSAGSLSFLRVGRGLIYGKQSCCCQS